MEKTLFDNLKVMFFRYYLRYAKAFLMVLVSNCLLILNPLIFRQAVISLDPSSGIKQGALANALKIILGSKIHSLTIWALILISIALISGYFKYQMRIEFIAISREAEKEIRSKLFYRIQSQSRAFYDHHGIGELLSRLTNDISAYRDVLGPGMLYPLFYTTIMVPGLMALFSISWRLTLISLIPLVLIPFLNSAIRKQMYRVSLIVQKSLGTLSNMAQEYFSGIRIIKGYVIENKTLSRFKQLCKDLIRVNIRLACLQGMLLPFFTLMTRIVTVVLVMFSGIIILNAWGSLGAADFVSFMWIQSYIFLPLLMLAWVLPLYEKGRAAYERLVEIYFEPIEVSESSYIGLHIPPKADIELCHLTFAYPRANASVLNDLNLHISGGSFIGITGPVGAGKSTLLRLLNREYEIPSGKIFIGGRDIHEYDREAFNQAIVTVEQVPFLFSKTIAENLRFGREEASQEELEVVADLADLHETVLEFPDQYNTMVGERGVTLSGGQKQRVAMARAFLVNRSILLLDDIFSAVDASTERRIFQSMKKNFKDKTLLLVTHRVAVLEKMDRVIYIKNGRIEEEGPPSELKAQKGLYHALIEIDKKTEKI